MCYTLSQYLILLLSFPVFFQAEDGIRGHCVTGVQTCALPISLQKSERPRVTLLDLNMPGLSGLELRSEEHTSELQSHSDLVCRLLLEKKKKKKYTHNNTKKQITHIHAT